MASHYESATLASKPLPLSYLRMSAFGTVCEFDMTLNVSFRNTNNQNIDTYVINLSMNITYFIELNHNETLLS